MRCGKCKENDVTIAHVRSCYKTDGTYESRSNAKLMTPASDAQVKYALGLQDERDTGPSWTVYTENALRSMERVDVSRVINSLKAMPKNDRATGRKEWTMPAGRYAIQHSDTGEWWFFQVDKPTDGRWKGYTFIKRLIGAPGAYRKLDMHSSERVGWLSAIEDDPKTAMVDYGMQSGVCGRCSSPLTDPESLALGLGPICAGKTGWF